MNRRQALASLLGLASAAIVDPERLLWTRGKKLISIPRQRELKQIGVDFYIPIIRGRALDEGVYLEAAAAALAKRIGEMSRRAGRLPEFLPLTLSREAPAAFGSFGFPNTLKNVRYSVGFDVLTYQQMGRLDCLVKI